MLKPFSLNSIRARLTLSFSLATAALMLLTAVSAAFYMRYDAEQDADALLNAAAHVAQRKMQEDPAGTAVIEFEGVEPDLADSSVSLVVFDSGGQVLRHAKHNPPPWPHADGDGWRVATLNMGDKIIVAGMPWRKTERALRKQILTLAGSCVVVLFAVTGGVWLIVGQALSPLRRLSSQARASSVNTLRIQLAPSSHDTEIVELV